jgi:flavodoxin
MNFIEKYLNNNRVYDDHISIPPDKNLGYIVVIPAYNEDCIRKTLNSINEAQKPSKKVEIIIVINSSEKSSSKILQQNKKTTKEIKEWINKNPESFFDLYVIEKNNLPLKYFGAGYARKIGMDEAISRFNQVNQKEGYLISLDADVEIDKNYFTVIEESIKNNPRINAGIVYFEHPIKGSKFSKEIYSSIIQYELYLRYYKNALHWAGFPYAFHTIGSAFIVKAEAYVKQGGMNRKQAGEDFYFLNKIFQLGNISEISNTRVIPSPRPSDRVVFGTGPEVSKRLKQSEELKDTYDLKAFEVLKDFYSKIRYLFKSSDDDVEFFLTQQNKILQNFLEKEKFSEAINRINNNCKNEDIFLKHFYNWFDGLKIIRFLRISHEHYFSKQTLRSVTKKLLSEYGIQCSEKAEYVSLLEEFRNLERSNPKNIS